MHLLEAGLDERAGQQRQRRPVDPASDLRRQMALEKGRGMLRLRKDRLEETVMRMRGGDGGVSADFHGAEFREIPPRDQGRFRRPGARAPTLGRLPGSLRNREDFLDQDGWDGWDI